MNVKIKRTHPDAVIPQYATEGAAGFDLVAVEDVIIAPGETVLVCTGLAFEIPSGYEMQVRPRSGISAKTKLRVANSPGTVDADFRGEVAVIVDNLATGDNYIDYTYGLVDGTYETEDTYGDICEFEATYEDVCVHYKIRKGDCIAQGVIAPVVRAEFTEVDGDLTETERGAGGFGSTGT